MHAQTDRQTCTDEQPDRQYLEHSWGDEEAVGILRGHQPDHCQACQSQGAPKMGHMAILDYVEVMHGVFISLDLLSHTLGSQDIHDVTDDKMQACLFA